MGRYGFDQMVAKTGFCAHFAISFPKAEALKQIPMADCHVLISDIGLPDGNGWELMQELENLSPHYAIAMSGYGMKADCERSAQSGFRHHLVKPVSPHRLDTLLEEATNELKEKH